MKRWLAIAALALAGCSTPPKELPYPPQRVFQNFYSFMPPAELGWRVLGRNQHQLAYVRAGINADEAFAIQGKAMQVSPDASREAFFEMIKKGLAQDAADPRYKVLKHDVIPETANDKSCMRFHFIAEDHAAVKRIARPGVVMMESVLRYCVHPKNSNFAVMLGYSHRRYPEHADAGFAEKAERLLSSLEFLDP